MFPYRRVCLITNRYPTYPDDVASPFVRDFHLGLKKRGLDVSVFTPSYWTPKTEGMEEVSRFRWAGGKKVVGALNPFSPREMFQLISFFRNGKRQLSEHLERTKPDVCLALWALPSGWFAYQAKRKLGLPYSVWCLGSDIYLWAKRPIVRSITRKVLEEADHLFADGFDLSQKVKELSGRDCAFLPSMRKLPQTSGADAQLDRSRFNFLYLGRWEKKKGLDDLLKTFSLVKRRVHDANLHILGWGPFEGEMRRLVREFGLEDVVKIAGKVSTDMVAGYIKQADCVVIPSKSDSIPLVFSEALQMETPLLVSDVGDMGKLVREFKLGKVVPPGDVRRLAEAMIEFAREEKDYTENMHHALKLLDVEKAVEDYLSVLAGRRELQTPIARVSSH